MDVVQKISRHGARNILISMHDFARRNRPSGTELVLMISDAKSLMNHGTGYIMTSQWGKELLIPEGWVTRNTRRKTVNDLT